MSAAPRVPGDLLERLGLHPEEERPFVLADGRGFFTLEGFGLAADPADRRLLPVPALLK